MNKIIKFAVIIILLWPLGGSSAKAVNFFPCNIKEYLVVKGDCLSLISKKLNVSVNTLKLLNKINNSRVRIGTKLHFPTFSTPFIVNSQELIFQIYFVYTANSKVFLCGVTKGVEKQEVYIFERKNNFWQPLEEVECSGLPLLTFEVQMHVRDIDRDSHDECYILRTYGCSAKDVCFEGYYHIPAKSERLHELSIDTYLFNQEKPIDGRQKISVYYGEKSFDPTLSIHKNYLLKRLEVLFDKYFPSRDVDISRQGLPVK